MMTLFAQQMMTIGLGQILMTSFRITWEMRIA
jgi:hypothetical protein